MSESMYCGSIHIDWEETQSAQKLGCGGLETWESVFRPSEPFRTGGQQEEGEDGVGKIKGASLITRLKDTANQGQP